MTPRSKWQGMQTIARLNWPYYVGALAVLIGSLLFGLGFVTPLPLLFCVAAFLGAGWFLIGSLGVSHLVYDRSDLYRFNWLGRAMHGADRRRFIFCHTGFDETSQALKEKCEPDEWLILDHYDPVRMTEASIQRARRLYPPAPETRATPFDRWPETGSANVIFALLAIHELRTVDERARWFTEAKLRLCVDGRIILVEHLRDLPNFLAFGPGFLHFHSRASWHASWEQAGLRYADEFSITPWVRVFILRRP